MSERNWRTLDELLRDPNVEGKRFVEADRAEAVEREGFARYAEAKQEADLLRVKLEAAEREITEVSESLQAESNDNYEAWQKAEATLAAVREARPAIEHALARDIPLRTRAALEAVLTILEGGATEC